MIKIKPIQHSNFSNILNMIDDITLYKVFPFLEISDILTLLCIYKIPNDSGVFRYKKIFDLVRERKIYNNIHNLSCLNIYYAIKNGLIDSNLALVYRELNGKNIMIFIRFVTIFMITNNKLELKKMLTNRNNIGTLMKAYVKGTNYKLMKHFNFISSLPDQGLRIVSKLKKLNSECQKEETKLIINGIKSNRIVSEFFPKLAVNVLIKTNREDLHKMGAIILAKKLNKKYYTDELIEKLMMEPLYVHWMIDNVIDLKGKLSESYINLNYQHISQITEILLNRNILPTIDINSLSIQIYSGVSNNLLKRLLSKKIISDKKIILSAMYANCNNTFYEILSNEGFEYLISCERFINILFASDSNIMDYIMINNRKMPDILDFSKLTTTINVHKFINFHQYILQEEKKIRLYKIEEYVIKNNIMPLIHYLYNYEIHKDKINALVYEMAMPSDTYDATKRKFIMQLFD